MDNDITHAKCLPLLGRAQSSRAQSCIYIFLNLETYPALREDDDDDDEEDRKVRRQTQKMRPED